ncbi:hypothetical protein V491_06336 [Pseudogymnoascus sp. VKM F-3775]|nr:hypothetical protein V491_06336 [Pseudogymnoascus sp. VKM F-3775]
MILNNGTYGGRRILSQKSVDNIFTNFNAHFNDIDVDHGLGFELNQYYTAGPLNSLLTASHTGFTGTSIVIDRGHNTFYLHFSNRVHPSRVWSSNNIVREALGALNQHVSNYRSGSYSPSAPSSEDFEYFGYSRCGSNDAREPCSAPKRSPPLATFSFLSETESADSVHSGLGVSFSAQQDNFSHYNRFDTCNLSHSPIPDSAHPGIKSSSSLTTQPWSKQQQKSSNSPAINLELHIRYANDKFKDASNPAAVIQVGKDSETSIAEVHDMRFIVSEVLPGAIISR